MIKQSLKNSNFTIYNNFKVDNIIKTVRIRIDLKSNNRIN